MCVYNLLERSSTECGHIQHKSSILKVWIYLQTRGHFSRLGMLVGPKTGICNLARNECDSHQRFHSHWFAVLPLIEILQCWRGGRCLFCIYETYLQLDLLLRANIIQNERIQLRLQPTSTRWIAPSHFYIVCETCRAHCKLISRKPTQSCPAVNVMEKGSSQGPFDCVVWRLSTCFLGIALCYLSFFWFPKT